MTESSVATFFQQAGPTAAAVALLYMVWLFVSGKVHSDSEMKAKDSIIDKLERINESLVQRLAQTNDIFQKAIERGYTTKGDQK